MSGTLHGRHVAKLPDVRWTTESKAAGENRGSVSGAACAWLLGAVWQGGDGCRRTVLGVKFQEQRPRRSGFSCGFQIMEQGGLFISTRVSREETRTEIRTRSFDPNQIPRLYLTNKGSPAQLATYVKEFTGEHDADAL
jgi:hypothetical protein